MTDNDTTRTIGAFRIMADRARSRRERRELIRLAHDLMRLAEARQLVADEDALIAARLRPPLPPRPAPPATTEHRSG